MQKLLYIFLTFVSGQLLNAQTYTGTGGFIPDNAPGAIFNINVTGLTTSAINTAFGLEKVCVNITHTYDQDLSIALKAPDGTLIDLSVANGGSGNNYSNTCFDDAASNSILTGSAPFTGTFKPQGQIGNVNNGQNGNGTWKLIITDSYQNDLGYLSDWSITFGINPGQPFVFTSSNLPIVVINTNNQSIPDEPKLVAQMGIIYNGAGVRNYLTDPFNNYNNKIGIELRGSSSQSFPQKSYGIETLDINGIQKDTAILEMPAEHDWILYAPYDDKTCMRNVLSYDIFNKTGHYSSRTKFCELLINGQYQGIYVMMEKIKRDNNRVDISKLLPTDISGDQLTGGYIIKIDKTTGNGGSGWTSNYQSSSGKDINFLYHYPKDNDIVPQQKNYIQSYIDTVENVLNSSNFADPINGYRKYMSINSFIDYFILNEISRNVDGYRLSTYLHKNKQSSGGKLKIGPAWDYNLAWWNADYCDGDQSTGWAYQFNNVCGGDNSTVPFWWGRLLQDPSYTSQLKCRWTELRQTTLSINNLNTFIDSIETYLNEAQARHFDIWPILGQYTWPNPSPIPADYPGEIAAMKTWIQNRITWLDSNMPGTCNVGIIENSINENNVNIYPNPFNNSVHISFYLTKMEKLKIELTDIFGKTLKAIEEKEFHEGDNAMKLNFSDDELNDGIYFLKLISSHGTIVKKLSKVR